jgi:hypothetical protein
MQEAMTEEIQSGRPPHEPTDETRKLAAELASWGIPKASIARRLDICQDTLNKYYDDVMTNGKTDVIRQVANKLYTKAIEENDLSAQVFYLKTQGGWSDKPKEDGSNKQALSIIEQLLQQQKK